MKINDWTQIKLSPHFCLVKLEPKRETGSIRGMQDPTVRGKERFAEILAANFTYQEWECKKEEYPQVGDIMLLPKIGGQTFKVNKEEYQVIHIEDIPLCVSKELYLETIVSSDRSDHTINI